MFSPTFGTDLRRPIFGSNRIIDMRCTSCGAEVSFNSESDPDLPGSVGLILADGCPTCDDGDGTETWFTYTGQHVAPDWLADMAQAQFQAAHWFEAKTKRS